MVWYRYEEKKKGLKRKTTREFIKKFKDGKPDLEYFGSGMCANYLNEPLELDIRAFEIFPSLKENSGHLDYIVTDAPRSFELCKEEGTDIVRFIIRSTKEDIESYAKSLDIEYSDVGLKMLPILTKLTTQSNYVSYFFDLELVNQFNFTGLEPGQEPLVNSLVRAMASSKNCGIMVQFLFTRSLNWSKVAKFTASKLAMYLRSVEKGKTKHVISGFDKSFIPTTYVETTPKIKELSSFSYQTGKKLEVFYSQKTGSMPITLSIRGMIVGTPDDIKTTIRNVLATFANVIFVGDSLGYFDYEVDQKIGVKWLENNNMGTDYAYQILQNNANMWLDMRWGKGRDFVPFLCLTPDEFSVFVSMPTDPNLPVTYRRQKLKGLNYDKMVYSLGKSVKSIHTLTKYGTLSNSLRDNVVGIGPEDLSRHVYLLAASGSGKSTLIRNLYKHLECANYTKTLENSSIYIDVKDEDAKLFLRQCEKDSFDNNKIMYLDINHTDFAVNLLELPKHSESNREAVVSRMVGHVIEMLKEFYSQPQTFVQMERILRLLLFYLYSNTDNPTILDLYEIIVRLQQKGPPEMQNILRVYKKVTGQEMTNALNSLSTISKDAWAPLLNRLEVFATDNYFKKKFGVKHSTIDFEKMFIPGNITIFRISDTETPKYAHGMAIMAIIIKIWFMIQYRAGILEQQKRSLVVLTLDEFQKIQDLSLLSTILSQAHSYNLGLILSHQNTAQINPALLETVVGNTATQIYGKVSGIDAGKIARIIDPHFAKELTDQITSQPDFVFTAKTRPPLGYPQGMPIQFNASPPPQLTIDESKTIEFIQKMKNQYMPLEIMQSDLNSEESKDIEWMLQLYAKFRPKEEWDIIKFLRRQDGNLRMITEGVKSSNRDRTRELVVILRTEGIVNITSSRKFGPVVENTYSLSPDARRSYFPESFEIIGKTDDVHEVARKAFDYYLDNGFFINLANQKINEKPKCDMIAYDYQNDMPISIEIESSIEIASHPERVRFNMTKWKDLGFAECHVWSRSKKIDEIKNNLGQDAKLVRTFVVKS